MDPLTLARRFDALHTPLLADACVRLQLATRVAGPALRAVVSVTRIAGRVLLVGHYGSVDIFLEALSGARSGDVLVVDNGQRLDPTEPEALERARFEGFTVGADDVAFGDDDGVLFAPAEALDELLTVADEIRGREREQADAVARGVTLREQLEFPAYIARRHETGYTFRHHLRRIGGAIEE